MYNFKDLVKEFSNLSRYESDYTGRYFPSRVYRKASEAILNSDSYEVVDGRVILSSGELGPATSEKFLEYVNNGYISRLIEYQNQYGPLPNDKIINDLMKIHGIGEVKAQAIVDSLGQISLEDFIKILPSVGEVIPGTNITYTDMMATGVELYKLTGGKRLPWDEANKLANKIIYSVVNNTDINHYVYKLGSLRRQKPTVGDIDLVVSKCDSKYFEPLRNMYYKTLDHILVNGESKISGIKNGFQVDIRFIENKCLGCHVLHGTGSQMFNIKMRSLAKSKGLKLNEYSIVENGNDVYFEDEVDVFNYLGVKYVEPQYRY